MNLRFNYLYRDAGNYKLYGSIIFSNPEKISLAKIEAQIYVRLIDQYFFDPERLKIPRLGHNASFFDRELNHDWNEFIALEETTEDSTDNRTISQFIDAITSSSTHP